LSNGETNPAEIAASSLYVPLPVSKIVMQRIRYTVGILALGVLRILSAEEHEIFVDSGACPGEGCGYCFLYVATSAVTVYEKPSLASIKLGEISSGDTFVSKSGEVHTVPTRFEVHQEHDGVRPGDEVFALTYLGEGHYRIFHNGSLTQADLGFSPWGGSAGNTCDNPEYCWGRLVNELEFTWWMWVIAESGVAGWVVADDSMREIENNR
jgi:hypothetical protein